MQGHSWRPILKTKMNDYAYILIWGIGDNDLITNVLNRRQSPGWKTNTSLTLSGKVLIPSKLVIWSASPLYQYYLSHYPYNLIVGHKFILPCTNLWFCSRKLPLRSGLMDNPLSRFCLLFLLGKSGLFLNEYSLLLTCAVP